MPLEIFEGTYIRICADFVQAASNIQWQLADDDPDEDSWGTTPYQVADASHDRLRALKMVDEWLDAQSPE